MTINTYTTEELQESYNEALDADGEVSLGGLSYLPSYLLQRADPIAYDCGFNDWLDAMEYDEYDGMYALRDDIAALEESEA